MVLETLIINVDNNISTEGSSHNPSVVVTVSFAVVEPATILSASSDASHTLPTCSSPRCPKRSHSLVCIKKNLFIKGVGPILNKEIEFIFRSDQSDRLCVYS